MTDLLPLDLDELEKVARAAMRVAPGAWESDTEKNEGEYGSGPDSREGFSSWFACDEKGRRLFDAYNADVICVHEEWDEDGGSATDIDGGKIVKHAVTFDPPTVLRLIDLARRSLPSPVEGVEGQQVCVPEPSRAGDHEGSAQPLTLQWRPIETAPKDGDCVLLYAPPRPDMDWPGIMDWAYWEPEFGPNKTGVWVLYSDCEHEYARIPELYTHWMKPPPPVSAASAAGQGPDASSTGRLDTPIHHERTEG